jgi:hypothetical protein
MRFRLRVEPVVGVLAVAVAAGGCGPVAGPGRGGWRSGIW